ncbi:YbaN family protein [Rhodobacteraceae bacterium F11138]|nr:YbaN family protein [Rhodobacteraceae bacterium F11138]
MLWTGLGCVALALGLVGVVLPVLPTTPFVILAAFLFSKGSPRLRHWLITHRVFGPLIDDWEAHGAIPRPVKRLACAVMALAFGASLWAGFPTAVLIVQALCLGAAATYVLTRPSAPR